jgi:hypothetical protein
MQFTMPLTAGVLALALAACSSSSSGPSTGATDAGAGAADNPPTPSTGAQPDAAIAPANEAKLVLTVPATFTGTTRELDVIVTPVVPVAGPPAAILAQIENPVVTPGQPLVVHGDATGVTGSYYVVAVLYMTGGGQFSPAKGVDYEAQTATKVTFDGGPIDLGTMTLALAGK